MKVKLVYIKWLICQVIKAWHILSKYEITSYFIICC